jgi:hypothetical protein
LPVFSVQYHPEASPGPHDAHPLFKRFLKSMEGRPDAHAMAGGKAGKRRTRALDSIPVRRPGGLRPGDKGGK